VDGFGALHGFLWNPSTGFSFTSLPGFFATDNGAINNLGQFVTNGLVPDNMSPLGGDPYAYIYSGGTYTPFAVAGAAFTDLYSINDVGQLSGIYIDMSGNIHGFVATPTPEPTSVLALGLMSVGMFVRRRKKG
jgi:hypothetical protein